LFCVADYSKRFSYNIQEVEKGVKGAFRGKFTASVRVDEGVDRE
jgi:hypothetical protein